MTTVPDKQAEQEQPISLRAMYAQIALADLPTPRGVRFGDELRQMDLTLDTFSDAETWARTTGATLTHHPNTGSGKQHWVGTRSGDQGCWHGWDVDLAAWEDLPEPGERLDTTTVTALEQVAAEVMA